MQSPAVSPHLESALPHSPDDSQNDHWCILVWVWRWTPQPIFQGLSFLLKFWCVLRTEGRSFLGRIRTRLGRKQWGVDVGPVLQTSPDGLLVQNERTNARIASIQALSASHPWASSMDADLLLMGFDAGEKFALRTKDTQRSEFAVPMPLDSPDLKGGV